MKSKKKIHPCVLVGSIILLIFIFIAVFAELLMPYAMDELFMPYQRPSSEFWLGTNDIGQDILSEIILGTRTTLLTGISAAASVIIIGTGIGLLGGYFGGKVDKAVQALIAVVMTLPQLPLAIVLVTFMSPSMWNVVIAITITSWAGTAKLVRAKTLEIRQLPFVLAEEMMGQNSFVIMFKHILPNMKDIAMMRATLAVSSAMLTEASLSFLGLGVFGQKSWGSVLYYAFLKNGVVAGMTWWYIPPIICISLCIFGFVLIGYYGLGMRNQGGQKGYQVDI
jgi:ABC-type dipeptide/oligopeptide/nickel transport systems, permease components